MTSLSLLPELISSMHPELNKGQRQALTHLASDANVFITGSAGTGKSYLLRKFLSGANPVKMPVLASTGAAAVLIGGRTFHSFFGLGIMEGGVDATLERALKDRRLARRLSKIDGFVLDEVSMIPGVVLETAERIASGIRGNAKPWGGLKVVAVGDFAQLPPVSRDNRRDWAFLNPIWAKTEFRSVHLSEMMRVRDDVEFMEVLDDVRVGLVTERVKRMLEWRKMLPEDNDFEGSVLYARKVDVDQVNQKRLAALKGESRFYETSYQGDERYTKSLAANAPIPAKIEIKKGALVMLRQNDPVGRFVNGSLGHIKKMGDDELEIELLSGKRIEIEKSKFSMLDAEGNEIASAKNFPINLAYAITIHKAQGATLDRAVVSLRALWEPGQAYVAMSRVKSSEGLMVNGWDERSIFADKSVQAFHQSIQNEIENPS